MEQVRVKNQIGYVSLVGICGEKYPLDFGNYFSLGGYHVLNMWYENFKHLRLDKEYIDAVKFGDGHIVIVDADIPEDYLNDKPCFTGGSGTTPEVNKEIYEFMFPRHQKLKCMCCESANYTSVFKHMVHTNKAGISLSKGRCRICSREVLMNNNSEVDEETYNDLKKIYDKAPSNSGYYLMPYSMVESGPVIFESEEWEPNKNLLSRYAVKKINKNFYGMTKMSDLKEDNDKKDNDA